RRSLGRRRCFWYIGRHRSAFFDNRFIGILFFFLRFLFWGLRLLIHHNRFFFLFWFRCLNRFFLFFLFLRSFLLSSSPSQVIQIDLTDDLHTRHMWLFIGLSIFLFCFFRFIRLPKIGSKCTRILYQNLFSF